MCSDKKLPNLNENYLIIDYFEPGKILSDEIKKVYTNEHIIFLKNHGVIFTHNDYSRLKHIINDCYFLFSNYKLNNYEKIKCNHNNDIIIKTQFKNILPIIPLTPDIIIYLNDSIFQDDNDDNIVYIIAKTKYKCYQILEVLNSYMILKNTANTFLSTNDKLTLTNRQDEIYRLNK
jgi:hypothetical protein